MLDEKQFREKIEVEVKKIEIYGYQGDALLTFLQVLNEYKHLTTNDIFENQLEFITLFIINEIKNNYYSQGEKNDWCFDEKVEEGKSIAEHTLKALHLALKDKNLNDKIRSKLESITIKLEKDINSNKCYIATMAYGDYDHQQVIELRRFRDNFLSKTIAGRRFIKLYYRYSPSLVEMLKNKENINLIIRNGLDQFIKAIKK